MESTSALDDLLAAKADQLVEGGFGIAHAAIGAAGDGVQRGFIDLHFLLLGDVRRGA